MARMRAKERRRQLLEVAAELFAQHGYRGVSVRHLADAAGITEPILYRHFENKLDLFVTLIDEVGRVVINVWTTALHDIDDPHERLIALLSANPAVHERGRSVYRIIFQAMTETNSHPDKDPLTGPAIDEALRTHITKLHAFVKKELAALQDSGVVRDDESAASLAWLLVDTAIGYGLLAPMKLPGQSSPTGRTSVDRLLEQLLLAE
jgi:AcrR family transcriptional regulator